MDANSKSLIIDEGNSLVKMSIMSYKDNIDKRCCVTSLSVEQIEEFVRGEGVEDVIYCSVREKSSVILDYLASNFTRFIDYNSSTPIPLKSSYASHQTIGVDRLAAAVGAVEIYPKSDILVVDFGSAITIDFIENGEFFLGGNISPGASLRFKSLNIYTDKLPLCSLSAEETALTANNTQGAIESGVVRGITYEIGGYIDEYTKKYPNVKIIFTGGDAIYFGSKFKMTIFANCEIVTNGLYKVLKYNDVKTQKK